jgi:cytochrome c553
MKAVVDKLTAEDFVNIAAYVSSREPRPAVGQTAVR